MMVQLQNNISQTIYEGRETIILSENIYVFLLLVHTKTQYTMHKIMTNN